MKYIVQNNEIYILLDDILNSIGNDYKNGFLNEVDGESDETIISHLEKRMIDLGSYINLSNYED